MGKMSFVVGLGVGYVLGTRAGRQRYEALKSATTRVWENATVQKNVHRVEAKVADVAREQGSAVTDKVASVVKNKVFGKDESSENPPPPTPPQPAP